ncbi:MAG: response regulator [Bryobacteraceae bacterium]|nr:response regulator [Bryobacteraceae bacterium]
MQIRRMLQCKFFRHSPRLSRFFTFTVDQAVAGCEQRLKEYAIALEVFGKPDTFDPRMDSAVRVAARQLRAKIDLYYLTDGAHDPVLVRYRPGDYMPKFYFRTDAPAASYPESESDVAGTRQVLVVEKDRSSIRTLTDCLDSMSYPIASVVDSGERCMEIIDTVGPCIVVTGLNLIGSMDGGALTRALRERRDTPVVTLVPSQVEAPALDDIVMSEPDALVYQPIRAADLRTALKIAVARRNSLGRLRPDYPEHELACA